MVWTARFRHRDAGLHHRPYACYTSKQPIIVFHVILRHHYAAMLNVDDMHTPAICRLDGFDTGAGTVYLVVKEATDRRAPSAYFAMGSLDGIAV